MMPTGAPCLFPVSRRSDAPYRPDAPDLPDFGGLQVALIGVPMDLGVTNRSGSRLGPRAMRNVERIGPYNHALRVAPMAECAWPILATCRSAAATAWPEH